jgi:hypothetical protein
VEPEETVVGRQRRFKYISVATNTQIKIEEPWEVAVVSREDGSRGISIVRSRYLARTSDDRLTKREDSECSVVICGV